MKQILYTQLSHLPHKITRSGQKYLGPTDAFINHNAAGRNDAVHLLPFAQGGWEHPTAQEHNSPLVPKGSGGKAGGEMFLPRACVTQHSAMIHTHPVSKARNCTADWVRHLKKTDLKGILMLAITYSQNHKIFFHSPF